MIIEEGQNIENFITEEERNPNRILEISFLGGLLARFKMGNENVEMEIATTEDFYKSLMQEFYDAVGFFDFRNDTINNTDAQDDLDSFEIKIRSLVATYGFAVNVVE